jgi:4-hydroxybenzoate polyprenyltransferase
VSALEAPVVPLSRRRGPLRAALVALRPRQWTKNLLLFAGIVFAAEIADPGRWLAAGIAFVAWCAASSAAYLLNDVRDAADDRRHPVKRRRPIARGELSVRAAVVLALVLCLLALALVALLGPASVLCLLAFLGLQAAYTLLLKDLVLVDVVVIATLFVLRSAAGAIAVDVRISPWLLVCTGLLALFLALGKRRAELVLVAGAGAGRGGAGPAPTRRALAGYDLALVDQLITVVAGATIVTYALYTFAARDSRALMVTIPLVVLGVFRYLLLLHRTTRGEEPENVLLEDRATLVLVAVWAIACATILVIVE